MEKNYRIEIFAEGQSVTLGVDTFSLRIYLRGVDDAPLKVLGVVDVSDQGILRLHALGTETYTEQGSYVKSDFVHTFTHTERSKYNG